MELLTDEIRGKLPKLYSQENNPDPIVQVKFFTPWSNWAWYVIEGEPVLDEDGNEEDFLFFGLVEGFEKELGYFSLRELESVKGPFGLTIERDLFFKGEPLSVYS